MNDGNFLLHRWHRIDENAASIQMTVVSFQARAHGRVICVTRDLSFTPRRSFRVDCVLIRRTNVWSSIHWLLFSRLMCDARTWKETFNLLYGSIIIIISITSDWNACSTISVANCLQKELLAIPDADTSSAVFPCFCFLVKIIRQPCSLQLMLNYMVICISRIKFRLESLAKSIHFNNTLPCRASCGLTSTRLRNNAKTIFRYNFISFFR